MRIEKLESIRGFVALYVVMHHFIYYTALEKALPAFVLFFFKFAQEAVITFFLMSGFVIYVATKTKHIKFKDYFLKRLIRIYPLAICSFILSAILSAMNNGIFSINDWKILAGNLLMLQDLTNEPGLIVATFKNNFPLWSLSYEWWFYMMFFPLYLYFGKRLHKPKYNDIYFVTIISLIGWTAFVLLPNHIFLIITYFALWWAGVASAEIYLEYKTFTFKNMFPILASLGVMVLFIYTPVLRHLLTPFGISSQINYRYPAHFYADSFLFIFFGLIWWQFRLVFFNFLFKIFSKIASISYALYIIHFPIIWLTIPFISNIYLTIIVKLSLVFLLSYIFENKMQPYINKLVFNRSKI